MCMSPKVPPPPPPPAQRQTMKEPEMKARIGDDPARRRRGYAALMKQGAPSLQPVSTTAALGG